MLFYIPTESILSGTAQGRMYHILFIHLPFGERSSGFQCLIIISNVAMNIHVQAFVCVNTS